MKILACCFPLRSHLNALFGVMSELTRRGHELVVVAPEYGKSAYCIDVLAQLGISAIDLPMRADGTVSAVVPSSASWASIIRDPSLQLRRYEDTFSELCKSGPRMRDLIAGQKPDAVVMDPVFYPAAAAAESLGIPWVGIHTCMSISVPGGIPSNRRLAEPIIDPIRDRLFASFGLSTPPSQYQQLVSPHLNIVWHKSALVGPPRFDHVQLVGPTMRRPHDPKMIPLANDIPSDRPVAYITFGGMVNEDPDVYRRLLVACGQARVYPIVSCPEGIRAELPAGPWTHTTDQLAAIARADLVIGYVGAVTLMEVMYFGKPLLSLPLHSDHPVQAWLIAKAGIGRSMPYHSPPADLARELAAALDPSHGYGVRAREISTAYREGDADLAAAELVEQLG